MSSYIFSAYTFDMRNLTKPVTLHKGHVAAGKWNYSRLSTRSSYLVHMPRLYCRFTCSSGCGLLAHWQRICDGQLRPHDPYIRPGAEVQSRGLPHQAYAHSAVRKMEQRQQVHHVRQWRDQHPSVEGQAGGEDRCSKFVTRRWDAAKIQSLRARDYDIAFKLWTLYRCTRLSRLDSPSHEGRSQIQWGPKGEVWRLPTDQENSQASSHTL